MENVLQNNQIEIQHPGTFIKKMLEERCMSQNELALRTGVSDKHISTILSGDKKISVSFARKLAIVFENDYEYWVRVQTQYDNYLLTLEEENDIKSEEKELLKPLKDIYQHLIEKGYLHNNCNDAQKVLQLREFACVNNLTAMSKINYNAAYRAQLKSNSAVDANVLFIWQRLCEKETEKISLNADLNTNLLCSKISEIKKLIDKQPEYFCNRLQEIFSDCGIAFAVVHHFKGAPVQGFIKKSETGKNILCLTIRNGRADSFWFTLFHEIGHIVHGDLSMRFVDFPSVKGDVEDAADKFAENSLINSDLFSKFIQRHDYTKLNEIQLFAKSVGVPDFIVIGRLQKMGLLDWSNYANHIPKYGWV